MSHYKTLREIVLNKTFDACVNVLNEKPIPRLEAICKVAKEMKADLAISERFMIELINEGILEYKDNKYSLKANSNNNV